MRKIIVCVISVLLILLFSGCYKDKTENENVSASPTQTMEEEKFSGLSINAFYEKENQLIPAEYILKDDDGDGKVEAIISFVFEYSGTQINQDGTVKASIMAFNETSFLPISIDRQREEIYQEIFLRPGYQENRINISFPYDNTMEKINVAINLMPEYVSKSDEKAFSCMGVYSFINDKGLCKNQTRLPDDMYVPLSKTQREKNIFRMTFNTKTIEEGQYTFYEPYWDKCMNASKGMYFLSIIQKPVSYSLFILCDGKPIKIYQDKYIVAVDFEDFSRALELPIEVSNIAQGTHYIQAVLIEREANPYFNQSIRRPFTIE